MQPSNEIRSHPVDLREFGITSTGASEYRLVWADSRTLTAFRGQDKLVTPKYRHGAEADLKGKWVLERWLSAEAYYGMDAEGWDRLQRTAIEQPKLTSAQNSEIDHFLSTLPKDQRTQVESMYFEQPSKVPVIEPYSHDGEYEFAGLYFIGVVEESYLKSQIRAHIWRLKNMTVSDRKAERAQADSLKDAANDANFETIWQEGRESSLVAQ